MGRYSEVIGDLGRDAVQWKGFRSQGSRVISTLECIVDMFNADIKRFDIPFSSIKWLYGGDGKTMGASGIFPSISEFNEAFKEWRAQTGCDANFFVRTRDGGEVEELIILDVTRTFYANTDTADLSLQQIMDDAVKENNRKD